MSKDRWFNVFYMAARVCIGVAAVFSCGWLTPTVPFISIVLIFMVTWFGWELFDLLVVRRSPVVVDVVDES